MTREWHCHGSDTPTSPRAILHHTDPSAPNISGGSVCSKTIFKIFVAYSENPNFTFVLENIFSVVQAFSYTYVFQDLFQTIFFLTF